MSMRRYLALTSVFLGTFIAFGPNLFVTLAPTSEPTTTTHGNAKITYEDSSTVLYADVSAPVYISLTYPRRISPNDSVYIVPHVELGAVEVGGPAVEHSIPAARDIEPNAKALVARMLKDGSFSL